MLHHSPWCRRWPLHAVGALAIVAVLLLATSLPVSAHAELVRSKPADGSIQGVGPQRVDLWFTEAADGRQSSIEVYDAQRQRVDRGDTQLDPADPRHLSVSLGAVNDGTYTVAWSVASTEDGHTVRGTFTFRVGQARLPGAAATQDESPSLLSVTLRWLVVLGLAAAAGRFLVSLLGVPQDAGGRRVAIGSIALAIAADLLLVIAEAYRPADGPRALTEAVALMPPGWLARLILEVGVLVAMLWMLRRGRYPAAPILGALLTAAAIGTMTLSSHAAAETDLRLPAMATNALHLESVAFWIGGVVNFALLPGARRAAGGLPLRRFSRLAVALAVVALATGALNAGVTLPSVASLWQSSYGRILLIKIVVVAGVLTLAYVNRRRVWARIRAAGRLAFSLRGETLLGVTVLLLAALLAFSAPPEERVHEPMHLRTAIGADRAAHLVLDPADDGRNRAVAWLSDADDQPIDDVRGVTVRFSMLERPLDLPPQTLTRQPDGRWSAPDASLTVKGWWEADLQFTGPGMEPATAQFFLLIPDPTFASAEQRGKSDPAAEAIYESAIARITELRSLRSTEELSDGVGNSLQTQYQYEAPNRLAYVTSSGNESVAIGDMQYYRRPGEPWTEHERVRPVAFPENLPGYYAGATDFTLGRTQEIDGELCQLVSFYVPEAPGREEAWYLWWVGTESQLVRRESMVARYHYMTNHYTGHDQPVQIAVPAIAGQQP